MDTRGSYLGFGALGRCQQAWGGGGGGPLCVLAPGLSDNSVSALAQVTCQGCHYLSTHCGLCALPRRALLRGSRGHPRGWQGTGASGRRWVEGWNCCPVRTRGDGT